MSDIMSAVGRTSVVDQLPTLVSEHRELSRDRLWLEAQIDKFARESADAARLLDSPAHSREREIVLAFKRGLVDGHPDGFCGPYVQTGDSIASSYSMDEYLGLRERGTTRACAQRALCEQLAAEVPERGTAAPEDRAKALARFRRAFRRFGELIDAQRELDKLLDSALSQVREAAKAFGVGVRRHLPVEERSS